jgi:2-polyprenyl-3-methyl-5-hydroxy-6-metoxy-1,4-benzoquinol methylase
MNNAVRNEVIDTTNKETTLESCRNYIASRHSGYEFRSIRYEAVLESLRLLGFTDGDSIADVGGADGEFGRYLEEQGIRTSYTVVDGMVDGTDLKKWIPKDIYDFMVSIEVIEHLEHPRQFLKTLDESSKKGVVLTTPNPHVTDVKAMDATHISEVYPADFYSEGYKVYPQILFFENGDSLLAIKDKRSTIGL